MKTIAIANQKGGVAKTTTAAAIVAGLKNRGMRVLAVDLDPQTNFTLSCGVDVFALNTTIYDIFKGKADVFDAIIETPLGFDLLPGGLSLAAADMEFTQLGRERMLVKELSKIAEYDYIIIDTPPTLGILTANALVAADYLVIPMAADIYSIQGLDNLCGFIGNVHEYGNPDLKIVGLLLTKYHGRQNLSKVLMEQIELAAEKLNTKVFETKIRESVAVREAAARQSDMFRLAPRVNAIVDYYKFVDELLGRIK